MDYLAYWSLRRKPFLAETEELFFTGASHREAMAGLSYLVASGFAAARLVAPRRCGMTRLLRHVQQMQGLGDTAVEAVFSDGTHIRGECLSTDLLNVLGIHDVEGDPGSCLAQMLQSSADQGVRMLWLIDQCHPNAVTQIEAWARDFPMLSVVMGSSRIAIAGGQLAVQSDSLRVDLAPLPLEDTFEYLRYCLGQAGGRATLFSDTASVRLHETSGGAIADLAMAAECSLRLAALHGFKFVTPALVEAANEHRRAA